MGEDNEGDADFVLQALQLQLHGELGQAILGLIADSEMRFRRKANAAYMARTPGTDVAAEAIFALART
jgi:UDP:flavonoid glycosyltransferase YjiC (YdhE family)